MNPENPTPHEELEARLTALLLGELPAAEAEALRVDIAKDADLRALYERLQHTIELVRETVSNPMEQTAAPPEPLKLSEAKREKLLAQFKTIQPKEFEKPAKREVKLRLILEIAAVMAAVGLIASLVLPATRNMKSKFESETKLYVEYIKPEQATDRGRATPSSVISVTNVSGGAIAFQNVPLQTQAAPAPATPPQMPKANIVLPTAEGVSPAPSGGGRIVFANFSSAPTKDSPPFALQPKANIVLPPKEEAAQIAINGTLVKGTTSYDYWHDGTDAVAESRNKTASDKESLVAQRTADVFYTGLTRDDVSGVQDLDGVRSTDNFVNRGTIRRQDETASAGYASSFGSQPSTGNGNVPGYAFGNAGAGTIANNLHVGDPEWVGALDQPDSKRSGTNQFVGRYAYTSIPADNNLNWSMQTAQNHAAQTVGQNYDADFFGDALMDGREVAGRKPAQAGGTTLNNGQLAGTTDFEISKRMREHNGPSQPGTRREGMTTDNLAVMGTDFTPTVAQDQISERRLGLLEKTAGKEVSGQAGQPARRGGDVSGRGAAETPDLALTHRWSFTAPAAAATPADSISGKQAQPGVSGVADNLSSQLTTRTFKVDANAFSQGLSGMVGMQAGGGGGANFGGGGGGGANGNYVTGTTFGGGGAFGGRGGGGGDGLGGVNGVAGSSIGSSGGGVRFVTGSSDPVEVNRQLVRNFFDASGVNLDEKAGKSVDFDVKSGELTVRGTATDLALVQEATKGLTQSPSQVNVKSKFAEVTANREGQEVLAQRIDSFGIAEPAVTDFNGRLNGGTALALGDQPDANRFYRLREANGAGDVKGTELAKNEANRPVATPSKTLNTDFADGAKDDGVSKSATGAQSTRDYPNATTMGSAQITYDPETHQLVVVSDDKTSGSITDIISNLDKPKPVGTQPSFSGPSNTFSGNPNGFFLGTAYAVAADGVIPSASTLIPPALSDGSIQQIPVKTANPSNIGGSLDQLSKLSTTTLVQDGKTLLEAGRVDEAETRLRQAVKNDPSNVAANQFLKLADEMHASRGTNAKVFALKNADPADVRELLGELFSDKKTDQNAIPYWESKGELDRLKRLRDEVMLRSNQEKAEKMMPKTQMVEVIDVAAAETEKKPTLTERISGAFGGDVTRSARIKVQSNGADRPGIEGSSGQNHTYDPFFVKTESEAIKSDAVMDKAVAKLKSNNTWVDGMGRGLLTNEMRELLKKKLDLEPVRNTSLLDIRAKGDKPEEAAQIANAVAEAYREYNLERQTAVLTNALGAYSQEVSELNKKIGAKETEVAVLREKLTVVDADPQRIGEPVLAKKPSVAASIPQPEVMTRENAFSTFSLNVSDVSFKLAAASLEKGAMPDVAGIRTEEFINAFDYRDPEPPQGANVGFAYERSRYPFAHNRDLLRFSVKTASAGRQAGQPMNIVLLLDNSGSMERSDRVRIIREALRVLASQLGPKDMVSVVTFARTARLWVDGVTGDKAGAVLEQMSGVTPEGGTNLEDAMNLAYATALRHYRPDGANRVVLLTDGAANLGDVEPETLKAKVESHRKQGVALDCFGIGWEGYNDDLLEVLSRNGDGRYGFINSPEEAATGFAQQLAGALQVAASDVKVQVEFNPKRVTTYRQIGYAKHQLKKEQFRDNTVDAAEIGAAESGNALYAVEVNPAGEGPVCTVRVRYKVPGTGEYREQAWTVPCEGNTKPLEESSPAMKLAGTASAFSEWLAQSPFAEEVTPDRLLACMSGVPEIYGADARPKKLEWMIRQAKSISGK